MNYRGADKSLVRPGKKQATATKLLQATHKKKIQKDIHPTRSPWQHWPPRRTKNGDLPIFFFHSGRANDLSATLYIEFW